MPAPPPLEASSLEWLKISIQSLGYIIGWVIVVVGWNVNNAQNRSRDERRDLRDRVNEIAELIRDVESDVVALLTVNEPNAAGRFWTVQFGVQRVNQAIVTSTVFNTPAVSKALINYRAATTEKAISGPTSIPKLQQRRDKDLHQVSKAGLSLVRAIEDVFIAEYPRRH